MRRAAAVAAAALAMLGAITAGAAISIDHQDDTQPAIGVRAARFYSHAVRGEVHMLVLLPKGYGSSRDRYPVIYFLHGLPSTSSGYRDAAFLRGPLARERRPAIVVAPQGARDRDTDPEYLDWGPGRNWETAVSDELPAYVDAHYRTIPTRRGRALVGLSAGGYGAVSLALHHLDSFGVVESWSGYFHPTDPSGQYPLDLGASSKNRRANLHAAVAGLRSAFARRPTFFAFYVGRGDDRFRDENLRLHRELVAAGVRHLFRVYQGAHERRVWSDHARAWLGLALAHLAPATDPPPLAGFRQVRSGPDGGVVLSGRIPDHSAPADTRDSAVYLPPGFDATKTYPLIVLLHGLPGSPSGFYDSLRFASVADDLIFNGRARPFVAVMPVAGRTTGRRSDDEWAGRWETFVVRDVLPWARAHVSATGSFADRAIAGLSAGAYGALDIALRHRGLFGVVESWDGYFHPFRDGPFRSASPAVLRAHDPTLLVRREAAELRRERVRFYLSTGFNHGGVERRWTYEFSHELRSLALQNRVWASRRPDGGRHLRAQLPAALLFAFGS